MSENLERILSRVEITVANLEVMVRDMRAMMRESVARNCNHDWYTHIAPPGPADITLCRICGTKQKKVMDTSLPEFDQKNIESVDG